MKLDKKQITAYLERGLRSKTHGLSMISEQMVSMSDGVKLQTKLYIPTPSDAFPVILIRNPYPHMNDFLDVYAHLFAQYGYAVVVQQCRGTGQSEGSWTPFVNERQDGLDTIDWIIQQPWCNGNIGTYGHSYLTAAQWAMADAVPQQVKTMVLSGFTTERYRQNYMNGMFRHDVYTGWAIDNSGIATTRSSSELFQQAITVKPHLNMDIELFGQQLPWYREWITNVSKLDPYWSQGFWKQLQEIPSKIKLPLLFIDGWFDQHLDGMVRDFYKLQPETRAQSKFIIGPWGHGLTAVGDLDYPGSSRNLFKDALDWLDQYLQPSHQLSQKTKEELLLYTIGESIWLKKSRLIASNQSTHKEFYLANGRKLSTVIDNIRQEEVSYIYNPNYFIPSKGGAGLLRYLSGAEDAIPAGSMKQPEPNYREDVCSFISDSLEKDLKIMGNIKIHLYVSTDAEDTSFVVTVMDINENGESYNIRDGISSIVYRNDTEKKLNYTPGEIVELVIELWPIAWTIKKGHSLRLDVQSSSFPAYHLHLNTDGPWAQQAEARIAKQSIYLGSQSPSRIQLPVSE